MLGSGTMKKSSVLMLVSVFAIQFVLLGSAHGQMVGAETTLMKAALDKGKSTRQGSVQDLLSSDIQELKAILENILFRPKRELKPTDYLWFRNDCEQQQTGKREFSWHYSPCQNAVEMILEASNQFIQTRRMLTERNKIDDLNDSHLAFYKDVTDDVAKQLSAYDEEISNLDLASSAIGIRNLFDGLVTYGHLNKKAIDEKFLDAVDLDSIEYSEVQLHGLYNELLKYEQNYLKLLSILEKI